MQMVPQASEKHRIDTPFTMHSACHGRSDCVLVVRRRTAASRTAPLGGKSAATGGPYFTQVLS